ncbi:MAG: tRNA (5-methylaminomethyl-2-thiouridine)(34)-methyltransferase MnmD [Saprospiraceae bacterium]|nr:tRNA (5-methylaminomethyl-2-thiouridine)(34)-methyltransferase MnmD [Candidatus Vicinibacter proximus]MBL7824251.1 tRNA (5-methylaminomethyl-2-thiouridine)(34)-methyltransferase MnmD [Saprospiraceae bacterium]MCC6843514.1 tRNA (5-methylaminomethyl-2-thiouridine)(34)-methyltransferase MnmD [Saprospiraceae bacterium]
MDKPVIFNSADGSDSLIHPFWNSSYHSKYGAISESLKVYIEYGLMYKSNNQKNLKIFELGFGTGLNVYLSLLFANQFNLSVNFHSIENMPLLEETWGMLNYPQVPTPFGSSIEYFKAIHQTPWDIESVISENFKLTKFYMNWDRYVSDAAFDIIYFDAFGPEVQPSLWSFESMEKLYKILNSGGVLLTFCAKGQFKRNLKSIGFTVESLPGPAGKREVTRAIKL